MSVSSFMTRKTLKPENGGLRQIKHQYEFFLKKKGFFTSRYFNYLDIKDHYIGNCMQLF